MKFIVVYWAIINWNGWRPRIPLLTFLLFLPGLSSSSIWITWNLSFFTNLIFFLFDKESYIMVWCYSFITPDVQRLCFPFFLANLKQKNWLHLLGNASFLVLHAALRGTLRGMLRVQTLLSISLETIWDFKMQFLNFIKA